MEQREMHSEVARFREQQALQEEASTRGLSGLAVVSNHSSIERRMAIGATRILALLQEGKHAQALEALFAADGWC